MEAATTAVGRSGRPEAPSLRAARRRSGEKVIKGVLGLAAAISLLTTVGIVYALVEETIAELRHQITVVITATDVENQTGRCSSRRASACCRSWRAPSSQL